MSLEEIKRRISALEGETRLLETCCLVRLPDGSEKEITLAEWIDHAAEWKVIRITQGEEISPLLCSLFSLMDQAVREDQESGSDPAVRADHMRSRDAILSFIEYAGGIT